MDLHVASRFEQVRGIFHIDFGEQGARSRCRSRRNFATTVPCKLAAREFGEDQIRVQPRPDLRGIDLRDIDVDAQSGSRPRCETVRERCLRCCRNQSAAPMSVLRAVITPSNGA